jgi:DNA-binding beta-propeller fold protein YncE
VDDTRQLFAGAGPIFRIDIATRQATEMPAPVEGWHASGLAYDPAGVLYVAEAERQRVRGLNVETGEIFDVVGQLGSRGVQLRALPASLSRPADIALLPDGSLLIADYDENVVLVAR